MASSCGYTVATVLTALHEAIPEQQAIISTAQSEDAGLINQTQVDQDACMELSEYLVSLDPGSILYQIPLRSETAKNWLPKELQSFVSTPIMSTSPAEDQGKVQTQPIRDAFKTFTGTVADRIQKLKSRSRSPTIQSDTSQSAARPRDFPDNAPKVQQHIGSIEQTLHQQQLSISPQVNSKATMHYNLSSVSNASSKARKLAAMQSEIAAAELKLLQAKLWEAELAFDSRGSLADSPRARAGKWRDKRARARQC